MTPEQQDALRNYLMTILDGQGYINDWFHTLAESGLDPLLLALIHIIGWVLKMIGGF